MDKLQIRRAIGTPNAIPLCIYIYIYVYIHMHTIIPTIIDPAKLGVGKLRSS